jgi:hypothetical protein
MPRARPRQRIVICDCRDCEDFTSQPLDYAWERAARQLPPPRSLVLLLEGFNSDASSEYNTCSLDELVLPHFDNVARKGVTCCAAVPTGMLTSNHPVAACLLLQYANAAMTLICCSSSSWCVAGITASLLEQVLGCNSSDSTPEVHSVQKVFMGMQCAVSSTSQRDLSACKQLNVHEVDILSGETCRQGHPTTLLLSALRSHDALCIFNPLSAPRFVFLSHC